jgi:hypothetical protein
MKLTQELITFNKTLLRHDAKEILEPSLILDNLKRKGYEVTKEIEEEFIKEYEEIKIKFKADFETYEHFVNKELDKIVELTKAGLLDPRVTTDVHLYLNHYLSMGDKLGIERAIREDAEDLELQIRHDFMILKNNIGSYGIQATVNRFKTALIMLARTYTNNINNKEQAS